MTLPYPPLAYHTQLRANTHFSTRRERLFVALFMGLLTPGLFVCFRGWFDVLFSPHLPLPLFRLALIINCIIGFACCLLCPGQLVSPWGRFSPAVGGF